MTLDDGDSEEHNIKSLDSIILSNRSFTDVNKSHNHDFVVGLEDYSFKSNTKEYDNFKKDLVEDLFSNGYAGLSNKVVVPSTYANPYSGEIATTYFVTGVAFKTKGKLEHISNKDFDYESE